ncbi:SDR family NAD(P)-dependent oxidoreductase [Hydrocarboniclastica marina]|uniref:SDR family NAD(P)-dependent oxidoreductase n=1 Tax=Hydrocarboniclastica marina TaxID=2259620 RepID=A0A4P7XJA9_9ALTE|nr:glucose 1-dehydrogenase [Hydrocarboniclastica marina]QCF27128.1 SDR family NAD(P)-dependent oxidoreductase [Hydrocarboniclastica marina]
MDRLKQKVAIITGGSLGIGRAAAIRMAEEGAAIAVLDCLDAEGRALAAEISAKGLSAAYWHCNVASEQEVAETFRAVADHFGHVDVLVNNAGIAGPNKPTHELTEEEWDGVQAVNVKGVFLCTKHAIPLLRAAGGGSIINLSSIYGLVSAPDIPPYHASKGAVRMMTKTDALLYAADRIRVNSVHPGFIWTPLVEHHLKSQGNLEEGKAATAALHPLEHMGEPDDIAWGIVYLASDESKFMTGSELVIDGGYTAR